MDFSGGHEATDTPAFRLAETGAIQVIRLAQNVDPIRLKRQLWLGSLTCVFSLIGVVGLVVFIRSNPPMEDQVARFLGFLLFTCGGLFVVAFLTTIGPILEAFVYERLGRLKAEEDVFTICIDFEKIRTMLATLVHDIEELDEPRSRSVVEKHKSEIAELTLEPNMGDSSLISAVMKINRRQRSSGSQA